MSGSITGGDVWTTDGVILFNVAVTTYILMAVTGLGYLALTWSTVVLLGGFVTELRRKDFWSLTIISMTQATRIFNDLAERLVPDFVSLLSRNIPGLAGNLSIIVGSVGGAFRRTPAEVSTCCSVVWEVLFIGTIVIPFQAICVVTVYLYRHGGPVACILLALWRIAQRDYGDDGCNGNLMAALDIFYSLILFQGVLYVMWAIWVWEAFDRSAALEAYRRRLGLPNELWCRNYLVRYLTDARARCWRDPASIRGRTLLDFAVDSLDSGPWEDDMLSGVRLLDAFVAQGVTLRSQLLPFKPRIQETVRPTLSVLKNRALHLVG